MDCLHCGRPLTFLKKWGDSRFCSAEHERAWKDSVQETMLDRLRVTAEQFRRAVQSGRVAAVPISEPGPETETFPTPPAAGFRISAADPVESSLGPLMKQVADPAGLGVQLPSGPPFAGSASLTASVSFPLSADAYFVVPVVDTLAVATQSSS